VDVLFSVEDTVNSKYKDKVPDMNYINKINKYGLNFAGFFAITMFSVWSYAQTLQEQLNSGDKFYIAVEPIEGATPEPSWLITKDMNNDWQLTQNIQLYGVNNEPLRENVTISASGSNILLRTQGSGFNSVSFPSLGGYSSEGFINDWGQLASDQFQAALAQGLLFDSQQFQQITSYVSLEIIDSLDSDTVNIIVDIETLLEVPQSVIDNLEGGWQGPTLIVKTSPEVQPSTTRYVLSSFDTDHTNTNELLTGAWVVPALGPIVKAFGSPEPFNTWMMDKINFSDLNNTSEELGLIVSAQASGNSLLYSYTASDGVQYDIKASTAEQFGNIALLMFEVSKVEGTGLDTQTTHYPPFLHIAAKVNNDEERLLRGLTTRFPFIQNSFINSRDTARNIDGQLDCFGVFGYVFNADGTLERGVGCNDPDFIENSGDETIRLGDTRWTWSIDDAERRVTLAINPDSGWEIRERYWDVLSTNEAGMTLVFERSIAQRSGQHRGYFMTPRLNFIKLLDVSQLTGAYVNGGFDGDNDLDAIADSADSDDDNDGLPDFYEESYSLNHLNPFDKDSDLDGDGLTNFEEYQKGTYPNDPDSDNDGFSDADDAFPLDATETLDTDLNGVGNNADPDDDGDGINDNIDNNPLVFDEEAPTLYSGQLTVLPDLNDDGIAEIGILKVISETGKVVLEVLNGQDQSSFNTIAWADSFEDSSLTLHVIPDMNDNGFAEVGLFGIQDSTNNEGKPQMFVRDLQTGSRVNVYNWPANWKEVSAMLLTDISGDGIAEIGIQGRFKDGNRPQLVVKNGGNGSNEATYAYPDLFDAPMFYQHSDVDGDGFEEIATFGVISRNGKIQVKIANGINANNKLKAYNFPDSWDNVSWHRLDDSNGDGIDDWGLFGISKADGRPQLINKDGTDPKGALRIYAWTSDMSNAQFYRIPDMNNDGVDEVAAAGRRSNGRYQFQVQDGVDRNSVLANHNLNLKLESVTYHVLPDLSGDEKAEIGFLGINAQGEYELVIQHGNTADGEYKRYNLGSDWQSAPSITSLGDTDDDGLPDLLVYGQNATGEQLVMTSL
jgi:hypothetical protein